MKEDNPEFCRCLKCNRKLKTDIAKKRGYGERCWQLHKLEMKHNHSYLFNVKTV